MILCNVRKNTKILKTLKMRQTKISLIFMIQAIAHGEEGVHRIDFYL